MKIVFLHPPLYPVNHSFFNELGKHINLIVYSFGDYPGLHSQWRVKDFISDKNSYQLKIINGQLNKKRKAISYRTQLSPNFLFKIKQEQPDIVVSIAFWFPSLYIAIIKNLIPSKLIIVTDAICTTEANNSHLRNLLRKIIALRTDSFIACSDLTESYLKTQFPNTPVKKSFQTIDIKTWKDDLNKLSDKNNLRKQLKLPENSIVILSVGNFIPLKNLEKLINEIPPIANCFLVLIGNGELKTVFEKKIKALNAEKKVTLVDQVCQNKLKKYYKAADIFIFPTHRDTFGYVVLEALTAGLPVICSKKSGVSCVIKNGENGFLIHPKDNLAVPIKKTIANLKQLSQNAKKSTTQFSFEQRAKEYINIFQMISNDS